jgi:hypothetical protein
LQGIPKVLSIYPEDLQELAKHRIFAESCYSAGPRFHPYFASFGITVLEEKWDVNRLRNKRAVTGQIPKIDAR